MYCDLQSITEYLGITETTDDSLLSSLANSAKAMIDRYCNRSFSATTNTTRYFDAMRDVNGATLYLDADLCAINSITNGDGVVVSDSQYTTEPRNTTPYYAIRLLKSSGKAWATNTSGDSEDAIAISGKWAYSLEAPDDIVQVQIRLTAYLYRQKDNAGDLDRAIVAGNNTILPAQLPSDILRMLTPYRKVTQ